MSLFEPSSEHHMLRNMLRSFVEKEVEPQALEFNRDEKFNLKLFKRLSSLGLLGITASSDYGGAGMDALSAVIAHEELAYSDPGFALAYLAHAILCVNNLSVNANKEQKETYLKGLCEGTLIGAMAMSEPHMGTDLKGMKTFAERKGESFLINGTKMWITNGCIDDEKTPCDLVWLYAMTEKDQISTFLVSKDDPGFFVGQKIIDKTGMRSSNTAEIIFKDCRLPKNALIGSFGSSWDHMMKNLELERLCLAAISLGIAKRSLKVMNTYAKQRRAFGEALNHFGQIQKYIGDSYSEYQAARSYVYYVATQLDLEKGGLRVDSDGAKLIAAKVGKKVADSAMQVLGGYGYVGEYVVERLWRDAKLLEIGGGTLEAHQKNITYDLSKNDSSIG